MRRFCRDETWQVDLLALGSRCQVHLWESDAKWRSSPALVHHRGHDVILSSGPPTPLKSSLMPRLSSRILSFVLSWHSQAVFCIVTPTLCLQDWAALNIIHVIRDNDFHYSCTFPISQLLFFLMVFVSGGLSSSLRPEGSRGRKHCPLSIQI